MAKQKVLIVDDKQWDQELLSAVLKDHYEITLVGSGPEGLDMSFLESPDFILVDLMMPERIRVEIIAQLKAHTKTANKPIILIKAE